VVVVSMAGESSALGIAALHAGAIDLVQKPTAQAVDKLYSLATELVAAVKAAAGAQVPAMLPMQPVAAQLLASSKSIVVVGASTGGPQALSRLVKALPADFPLPVAMVLHLPAGYTQSFAERLNGDAALNVVEASPGLPMIPGQVVVARAGLHLRLVRHGTAVESVLDSQPSTTPHRPAVDVLFESAAQAYGARVLGVVLTGMGDDGTQGARAIKAAGGELLTEAESSCVVYGMPRSVVEAGLSAASVRIDAMAAEIVRHL
jgi:two-component system, chemotaxis family, protein-glutamate methylesterase/glutaminase